MFVQRCWRKWFGQVGEKFGGGQPLTEKFLAPFFSALAAPLPKFISNSHEWAWLQGRKWSIAHHSYLWAVSWARVNAVPNPVSLLRVQLVSLWHIPFKSAKPKQRNTKKKNYLLHVVVFRLGYIVPRYIAVCNSRNTWKAFFFFWTGNRMRQEEKA